MSTIIAKGTKVTNPSADDIGRAQFARVTATSGAQTIVVKEDGGAVTLGEVYLHSAGDSIIIEKAPGDEITVAAAIATAVGSPRS
jgi:hypothetical protein